MQSTPAMQLSQALDAIEDNRSFPTEGTRHRIFCFACSDEESRCPTCSFKGERILLDCDQTSEQIQERAKAAGPKDDLARAEV
jgi:hypothetical protein